MKVIQVFIRHTRDGVSVTRIRKDIAVQRTEAQIRAHDRHALRVHAARHIRHVNAMRCADIYAAHSTNRTDPFAWRRAYSTVINGVLSLADFTGPMCPSL